MRKSAHVLFTLIWALRVYLSFGGHLRKRTVLRHSIGDRRSIEPKNEILACSLYHFFGDNSQLVCDQNMFDLHHQALNQANIASGNAKDGCNGLPISEMFSVNHLVLTHCLTEESYFERGECLMGNLTFTEFSLTH